MNKYIKTKKAGSTPPKESSSSKNTTKKTSSPLYDVDIDFDDASKEWRKNKKSLKHGNFKYCCGVKKQCGKICKKNITHRKYHVNKSEKVNSI
jgi:hypothetical protein